MGNFNRVRRVKTGPEDWIDVRPLSIAESREFDKKVRKVAGDDEKAANLRLDLALERIVAWSDDEAVTPEQARCLPIDTVWRLYAVLVGLEDAEVPLTSGSDSTATSEE